MDFQIKEEFYIDGVPTKLISGAVHYFRIMPDKWAHTLYNLKAMGCNTVETYVPWNLHEPKRGLFNFSGLADIEAFIQLAQEMDLYVILRPSPYICAEWEFGGLPAWLLEDSDMRIRSRHQGFMAAVEGYYRELIPRLVRYQFTHGGPVLMVQIENEYGSYSEDKDYLRLIAQLMRDNGVDTPLFTSDGGWRQVLDAGSLVEDGILATANFGSKADENFMALKEHNEKHGVKAPFMCMEFWDGWFNNWEEPIIKRKAQETASEVRAILTWGSINFYMFQGGTNFGFYNGCSDQGHQSVAQITSYDYDAPLTEWGAPTDKFFAIQTVIKEMCPDINIFAPKYPRLGTLEIAKLKNKVSLFSVLEDLAAPIFSDYTLAMEQLNQEFGYVLYRTKLKQKRTIDDLRVVDAGDRLQFFINQEYQATQYLSTVGDSLKVKLTAEENQLDLLVENMGRNNYGPTLVSPKQRKGVRSGVMEDIHYLSNWEHYSLPLDNLEKLDFSKEWQKKTPGFYQFELAIVEPVDTFLDCSKLGKGIVTLNGFNLGKYWENGPAAYLYIPSSLQRVGNNELIVFDTEGREITELCFSNEPIYNYIDSVK